MLFLSSSRKYLSSNVTCSRFFRQRKSYFLTVSYKENENYLHFWGDILFLQFCCVLFENKWPRNCRATKTNKQNPKKQKQKQTKTNKKQVYQQETEWFYSLFIPEWQIISNTWHLKTMDICYFNKFLGSGIQEELSWVVWLRLSSQDFSQDIG